MADQGGKVGRVAGSFGFFRDVAACTQLLEWHVSLDLTALIEQLIEVAVGEQQYQVRLEDREQDNVDQVADATVRCLLRAVPAAVPGIAFLSGGQSAELASARLNAMNARFKSRLPWALAFSFARAIQQPALEIWLGKETNVKAAQQALLHRARCNRAARLGEYTAMMERT